MLNRIFYTFGCVLFLIQFLFGQHIESYELNSLPEPSSRLEANGVVDIKGNKNTIWFATGHGLSMTSDNGSSFITFDESYGIGRGSISALAVRGDTIVVATASDTLTSVSDDYLQMGTGISVSLNGGNDWVHYPQPIQPPVLKTAIQNVTWDIAFSDSTIWITSWGGGVMKSEDWGATWEFALPDTLLFEPANHLNHSGFSTIVTDNEVWVGTAGGLNKSTDNGDSWTHFTHTNQISPISGNWIRAMAYQKTAEKEIIWAVSLKTTDEDEFDAVSKSENGGISWETVLEGERGYNISVDGETVYVAGEGGLFKSTDYGKTWYRFPEIQDSETDVVIFSPEAYSVYAYNGTVWVGTADGLAVTSDNGYTWRVFRAYQPTGKEGNPRTYSYPNPFSYSRYNQKNNDGYVRLQYNTLDDTYITIKIYDFAMDLVKTVVDGKFRPGPGDYAEMWDCRNEFHDLVANGVYFYNVQIDGDGDYWGKIMVIE